MANSKLSTHYNFAKPNDARALNLMNAAAQHVVRTLPDIILAYGVSDEYSFVLHKSTQLFERRSAKLVSTIVSTFTASYVFSWREHFGEDNSLSPTLLPTFDGRAVLYPGTGELRDYLSWRQVDCHINNLYNTTFWAMVQQGGISTTQAEEDLKGTVAADKNEILWSRYGINYNNEPEMYKKGSVVYRRYILEEPSTSRPDGIESGGGGNVADEKTAIVQSVSKTQQEKMKKARQRAKVVVEHLDIIKDDFWNRRPWLLSGNPGRPEVNDNVS